MVNENGPSSETPYHQIMKKSQVAWRNAQRGFLSRPHELSEGISKGIDQRMKVVFSDYICRDRPANSVAWWVLLDQPHTPSEFKFDNRYPSQVALQDHQNYALGISALNEWATNQTARYFISHELPYPTGQAYGFIADQLMGRLPYPMAYSAMDKVKDKATELNADLNGAVFKAYFNHEPEHLNELVALAQPFGAQNIDHLAVEVGRNGFGLSRATKKITKWLDQYADHQTKRDFGGRLVSSILLAGFHRQPGVVEISLALPTTSAFMIGSLDRLIYGIPEGGVIAALATFSTIGALQAFSFPHELLHAYSASEDHLGLIPVTLQAP